MAEGGCTGTNHDLLASILSSYKQCNKCAVQKRYTYMTMHINSTGATLFLLYVGGLIDNVKEQCAGTLETYYVSK